MVILQRTQRSMLRVMCGAQLIDSKRALGLMLMLSLKEAMDQFAMASSVCRNVMC